MRYYKYILSYSVPLTACISIYVGGIFSYLAIFYCFVILPILEFLLPENLDNLNAAEEASAKDDKVFDWILYLNLPLVYCTLLYFLIRISDSGLAWWEQAGMVLAMGLCGGVIGINVAHELGHRRNKSEQFIAKLLLLLSLYMHFSIEHNHGHHKNMGTEKDPSSAKYNEPVYAFYFRSLIFSFFSAWDIQMRMLEAKGQRFISIHNQMLLFMLVESFWLIFIGAYFGMMALMLYLAAAFVGVLFLKSINYIEHYGLRRKLKAEDVYERIKPWHSWNSNHFIGRMVFYEQTRHSDHHCITNRKFQVLRNVESAPQLPAGYPAMILLSLMPPLWFRVMNKRVRETGAAQRNLPLEV